MRISRSAGYALLAISCIAQNKSEKVVLSQDIAKKYDIPLEYLLKILQLSVKANILISKRGPHGGFRLSRPPTRCHRSPSGTEPKVDVAAPDLDLDCRSGHGNRRLPQSYRAYRVWPDGRRHSRISSLHLHQS